MSKRTDERAQYLADLLTTAVEGGINYWAYVSNYRWDTDRPNDDGSTFTVHDTSVMVHETEEGDDEEGYPPAHVVTLDTIAHGIALARQSGLGSMSGPEYVKQFWLSDRTNGRDGDYDADIADSILQLGIFGKVIYG